MNNYPEYLTGVAAAASGQPPDTGMKSADYYEGYLTGWDLRRLPVREGEESLDAYIEREHPALARFLKAQG